MVLPFALPLQQVVECLDGLAVPFFVGGSVATVIHGEIRTTQDADLVLELDREKVAPLVACLRPNFFVDEDAVLDAVVRCSSCNVIHRATAFKVDFFARRQRAFSVVEMARRQRVLVGGVSLPVASAEDCVLTKLEWYEKGGRVSDRQWRDVLGVLKGLGRGLDIHYLREWAAEIVVAELLERAMREAGLAD